MKSNTHSLRFLLALGGKKVVVMQDKEDFCVYSGENGRRAPVSERRIYETITAK